MIAVPAFGHDLLASELLYCSSTAMISNLAIISIFGDLIPFAHERMKRWNETDLCFSPCEQCFENLRDDFAYLGCTNKMKSCLCANLCGYYKHKSVRSIVPSMLHESTLILFWMQNVHEKQELYIWTRACQKHKRHTYYFWVSILSKTRSVNYEYPSRAW